MADLSILIPSRHEMFLSKTIDDILEHSDPNIAEVIAVLDGEWADPPIYDDPRVHLIYLPEPVGQREATRYAARMATSKYVMKVDAHCAFDPGFDAKLLSDMQDDWTLAPVMKNLHAFNWVCQKCGDTRYQSPTPTECPKCDNKTDFVRDVVWIAKRSPNSTSFCFDPEPHFQYFGEYAKRPEAQAEVTETMSLQGSCFLMTRDKFFDLEVCDEMFGSWGSLGIEVACKTWLSGGKVMVSHKTWYAHLFRTQGGDFSFPYPLSGSQVERAKKTAKNLFFNNAWPKQIHPLSWLVERFWPVQGWTDEDLAHLKESDAKLQRKADGALTKGILYYTCNTHDPIIESACRAQLLRARNGYQLGSVSRQEIEFGDWNVVVDMPRSPETMHQQILTGLRLLKTDIVFLCESDVLYHPSHFEFVPPKDDVVYFNSNIWRTRYPDGHCVWTDGLQQVSGICAYRDLLLEFYERRVEQIGKEGFNRHYEPGPKIKVGMEFGTESWQSSQPNLDIRHGGTLTKSKWSVDDFRDKRYAAGWKEASEIPYWGVVEGNLDKILGRLEIPIG